MQRHDISGAEFKRGPFSLPRSSSPAMVHSGVLRVREPPCGTALPAGDGPLWEGPAGEEAGTHTDEVWRKKRRADIRTSPRGKQNRQAVNAAWTPECEPPDGRGSSVELREGLTQKAQ